DDAVTDVGADVDHNLVIGLDPSVLIVNESLDDHEDRVDKVGSFGLETQTVRQDRHEPSVELADGAPVVHKPLDVRHAGQVATRERPALKPKASIFHLRGGNAAA